MTTTTPPMKRSAVISNGGVYRYRLDRIWDDRPPATFIILNPSAGDVLHDDPIIRRCLRFAQALNCGGTAVINLYAYRATDPDHLFGAGSPIGPDNQEHIRDAVWAAARIGSPLIGAWGRLATRSRVEEILRLPGADRITALAVTSNGMPALPRLPTSPRLLPWTMPAERYPFRRWRVSMPERTDSYARRCILVP